MEIMLVKRATRLPIKSWGQIEIRLGMSVVSLRILAARSVGRARRKENSIAVLRSVPMINPPKMAAAAREKPGIRARQ